ncbi:CopG family transcriptional regulator [Eggerthellaceae bacterium PR-HUZ602407-17]|jgi:hypothetical protein
MGDKIIAIADNGQSVTQAMVDKWCEAYDKGEFPDGEYSTERIWYGVPTPTLSKTITFKISESLEKSIKSRAKQLGISASDFCREAISNALYS